MVVANRETALVLDLQTFRQPLVQTVNDLADIAGNCAGDRLILFAAFAQLGEVILYVAQQ